MEREKEKQQLALRQQQEKDKQVQQQIQSEQNNGKKEEKPMNLQEMRDDVVRHHRQQIDDVMETIKKVPLAFLYELTKQDKDILIVK